MSQERERDREMEQMRQRAEKAQAKLESYMIDREIEDKARKHGAYHADQLKALMKTRARVVNDIVVYDFETTNDSGEKTVTSVTVDEAIEAMKNKPAYGNLFAENVAPELKPGPKTEPATRGDEQIDVKKLTTEQYIKIRKENPEKLGLRKKQ